MAQIFSESIAFIARNDMSSFIKNCPFLSIITDGATDTAILSQEIVYCRVALSGVVKTYFVSVQSTEKADTEGILGAIKNAMASLNFTEKECSNKLVGFGSDGASVNVGKISGVATKLKDFQPLVQGIHCHTHRLELAYKD